MTAGLFERKHHIREEIPQRGDADGENFAEVEVPFQLVSQKIKR